MLIWFCILREQRQIHCVYKFTVKHTYISGIEEVPFFGKEVSVRKKTERKSFKWHDEIINIPLIEDKLIQKIARKWERCKRKM